MPPSSIAGSWNPNQTQYERKVLMVSSHPDCSVKPKPASGCRGNYWQDLNFWFFEGGGAHVWGPPKTTATALGVTEASCRCEFSQPLDIPHRRLAEMSLVFPVKVPGIIVADAVAGLGSV